MRVIGIDPGTTGALALVAQNESVGVWDLPTARVGQMNQIDIRALIDMLGDLRPDRVFVEQVAANALSYKGNFALGHALGVIHASVTALDYPMQRLAPKEWQAALGLSTIPAKERKDAHRMRAMELFPSLRPQLKAKAHHNRADAVLIAEAGRRQL